MDNGRNFSYDIIRTIAIVFVICIHSMAWIEDYAGDDTLTLFARAFYNSIIHIGVPLFVMLSGALLLCKEEPISVFYKKRMKRILIPFLLWSLVVHGLHYIIDGGSMTEFVYSYFQLTLTKGVHTIHWYIYLILGLYLITPILRHLFADRNPQIAIYTAIILSTISIMSVIMPDMNLVGRFASDNLLSITYFILGYVIPTHFKDYKNLRAISIFILILSVLLSIMLRFYAIESDNSLSVSTTITSVSLFALLSSININVKNGCLQSSAITSMKKINSLMMSGVLFVSSVSYGIYLSHIIFISIFVKLPFTKHIPLAVEPIVMVMMVLTVDCVMMFIIRKLKLDRFLM